MRKSVLMTPQNVVRTFSRPVKSIIRGTSKFKNKIVYHPKFLPAYSSAYKILPITMLEGADNKFHKSVRSKDREYIGVKLMGAGSVIGGLGLTQYGKYKAQKEIGNRGLDRILAIKHNVTGKKYGAGKVTTSKIREMIGPSKDVTIYRTAKDIPLITFDPKHPLNAVHTNIANVIQRTRMKPRKIGGRLYQSPYSAAMIRRAGKDKSVLYAPRTSNITIIGHEIGHIKDPTIHPGIIRDAFVSPKKRFAREIRAWKLGTTRAERLANKELVRGALASHKVGLRIHSKVLPYAFGGLGFMIAGTTAARLLRRRRNNMEDKLKARKKEKSNG